MFQYAPFKPGSKGTLSERAKALGLEPLALQFLKGTAKICDTKNFLNPDTKGKEMAQVFTHLYNCSM